MSTVILSIWSVKYGDGITSSSVSAFSHTALISLEKLMRSMSKSTSVRYAGLWRRRLNSSMRSSRRIYQVMVSQFCRSSLARAVAQLPPPITAICPGKEGFSILFTLLKFCCLGYPFGNYVGRRVFEAEFVLFVQAAEILMEFSGCCLREGCHSKHSRLVEHGYPLGFDTCGRESFC